MFAALQAVLRKLLGWLQYEDLLDLGGAEIIGTMSIMNETYAV